MTKKRRKKDDWRQEAFEFDSGVWDAYSHDLQRELSKRRNKPRSKGKKTNMKRKKRKAKQRRSGNKPATRTRRKRSRGLSGVDSKSGGIMQAIATKNVGYTQVGFSLLSFGLGTFAGSLLGKGSGWAGAAIGLAGLGIKNIYVGSFGTGVLFSRVYKSAISGTEGVDGLETVKARAKAYFSDLKDKFLPEPAPQVTAPTTTEGLNGDRVSYFVNPAKGGELDLSELDKISQQVTQMNQGAVGNLDPGDRNY